MSYAGIWVLVYYILSTGCELGSNIWLSEWSQDADSLNATINETVDPKLIEVRLGVYAALGVGSGGEANPFFFLNMSVSYIS